MRSTRRLTVFLAAVVMASAIGVFATATGAAADTVGPYQIINYNSGLCLDVAGSGTADGTTVLQWGCHHGANQLWHFKRTITNTAYFTMSPHHDPSGCLQAYWDGVLRLGGPHPVQLWTCVPGFAPGSDQGWSLTQAGGATFPTPGLQYRYQIINWDWIACLTVVNGSQGQGAAVEWWPCDGSPQQFWIVVP